LTEKSDHLGQNAIVQLSFGLEMMSFKAVIMQVNNTSCIQTKRQLMSQLQWHKLSDIAKLKGGTPIHNYATIFRVTTN